MKDLSPRHSSTTNIYRLSFYLFSLGVLYKVLLVYYLHENKQSQKLKLSMAEKN